MKTVKEVLISRSRMQVSDNKRNKSQKLGLILGLVTWKKA